MPNNNKKLFIIITILIVNIKMLFAQNVIYRANNHEMLLFENPNQQIIQLADDIDRLQFTDYIASISGIQFIKTIGTHSHLLLLEIENQVNWENIKSNIQNSFIPIRWMPAFYLDAAFSINSEFLITDRISVKFNLGMTDNSIGQFATEYDLQLVKGNASTRRCVFKMNTTNTFSPLELAMLIDYDSRTRWAQIINVAMITYLIDEYYPDQWHLNNIGQSGGEIGYDINAELAWDITIGYNEIVVSVIDEGMEEHEDFEDWQLLDGYTIGIETGEVGCCGRPDSDSDKHGQAVAGLIAAQHNEIGVRGVCPNCKILPINIKSLEELNIDIAGAIDSAWQNGADVLSNSWGYLNFNFYDAVIEDAILSAMTDGRNGLGCPVVFAAGNMGNVLFPSNVEGVITVGGMDHNGEKMSGSPFSNEIDIVAPAMQSSNIGGIVTMDRMGALGYSDENYTFDFGGTSSACPLVSGVVGLLLSILPELDKNEIDDILYLTARELIDTDTSNTWSGNGLLNAYEAVLMAQYMVNNNITAIRTGDVLGAFTENTLLAGNINLVGNLDVQNGADLHIYKGTEIKFTNTNFILMDGGDLIIEGTAEERVNFTSGLDTPTPGNWQGIIVESGNLEMNYCDISYADVGVRFNGAGTGIIQNSEITFCNTGIEYVPSPFITPNSSLSVENSSISGCDVGIHGFGGNIAIVENCLIGDNNTGVLIEQSRSYKITGNDIVLNHKAGLVVRNSSGGIIEGNVISGNGNEAEWQTDRITGGIFLHASSPTITNNIIQNNKLHGITEMNGSRPILNYRERALNQINNNGDPYDPAVFDAEIRWFDQSIPHLDYGHNDIMDEDGGYLIYGNYSPFNPVVRVRHNYWAEFEPTLENRFYPIEGYLFRPYDTEPNGTPPNGFFADAPALFDQGLQCAEDEDWDNAISTYHSIITSYPESKEASGSVIRLYAITKITDGDFQELQDYYNLLLNAFPETILSKTAEQYAILCDVALQAFAVAIGKYETILQNPPSLEDSVYAVIDIGQVYLASSVAGGNGLGRKAAIGTMPEYEPDDFADYEEKVNHALSAMMGKTVASQSEVLPMDFALYSNYPNPFNPITNIKIDIPENSHIKVTVIDLSGRVVTELMNHNITAGKHQTIWNGKDNKGRQVSSGVYLYILTAKSNETGKIFTKSNKMVLLK